MSNFEDIRQQCLESRELWKDPDFPAANTSLYYYQTSQHDFEWKRPQELVSQPVFISTDCEIVTSSLGNSWFADCLNVLRLTEGLLYRAVPADQNFEQDKGYVGMFRFRFWWRGDWTEVCVDDRLPVVKDQLMYLSTKNLTQFWPALFEKAYAKLHGSYEALKYGTLLDGLADLTGGIAEHVSLNKSSLPVNIMVDNILRMTSIVTCKLQVSKELEKSSAALKGVIPDDRYRVLAMNKIITESSKEVEVVKLRGIGKVKTKNGSKGYDLSIPYKLWMNMVEDTGLEVIHLDGDTARDEPSLQGKAPWAVRVFKGNWKKHITAGGCRNYQDTFHMNPQIMLSVLKENTEVVMAISQYNALEPQVIGFSAYSYELSETDELDTASKEYFKSHRSVINSQFTNSRQVAQRASLKEGIFLVIPSTYEPGHEAAFSFRFLSSKPIRLKLHETVAEMVKSPIVKASSTSRGLGQYQSLFLKSADDQKCVDAFELQELLEICLPNDYIKSCATLDVCRQIVIAFDTRGCNRISFQEFKDLICSIKHWQNVFKNHTKEKTGILRVERYTDALLEMGFKLPATIISVLLSKYVRKDGTLRFGDFVASVLSLTILIDGYKKKDVSKAGYIKMNQNELLRISLSC